MAVLTFETAIFMFLSFYTLFSIKIDFDNNITLLIPI